MGNKNDKKSFWASLPGILTGIAAVITAIGGILVLFPGIMTPNGEESNSAVVVEPVIPVIHFFTASPSEVDIGGDSNLSWSVSNATIVTIYPDLKNVEPTGTRLVYPAETTTYTLTATKGEESTDESVQVVVHARATGILRIDTTPVKGTVSVNGVSWGTAPKSQFVEVESYTVSFGAKAGYTKPADQVAVVTVDATTDILGIYVLIPTVYNGTLSIDTTPVKGEVFVNGQSWGTAPQSKVIGVGSYTVTFGAITGYYAPDSQVAVVTLDTITTLTWIYTRIIPTELKIDSILTDDYVERDWGDYGDTMVVRGSDATADTVVNLYWDITTGPSAILLNTALSNPDGTFEIWFGVPETVGGVHYIWVKDTSTGFSDMAAFIIYPTLTLDIENGPVGTVVAVSGSGFTADDIVDTITINGDSCTLINTILIDIVGKFTGAFVIPSVGNLGRYEITVTDSNGLKANSDFLITGLAEIVVSPTYGPPGSTITLTGSNFTQIAGTEVTVTMNTNLKVTLVVVDTDADGSFKTTFICPPVDFQIYTITATDEYFIEADDAFKVGVIALIINPAFGEARTRIVISGIGFAPGFYNLIFGDILYEDHGTVVNEAIYDIFYVPNVLPGIYDVTVIDSDENELTVQFIVTG